MGWPRSIVGALQRLNQRGLAERGDLFLSISREYTVQRSVPGERHGYILRSFGANAYRSEAQERKSSIPVEIPVPYQLHKLSEGPPQHTQTTQDELMKYYRDMALIRRMEITADILFKSQQIRGFCHLYDGQEAVAVGLVEALTDDDSIITAYRDHGLYLARGGTLFECFSELMGKRTGCSGGKGGSMHLYNVKKRFYGGWGIVGTSAPLGAGLSFAHKYLNKKSVAVAIYGDGAANQVHLGIVCVQLLVVFCVKNETEMTFLYFKNLTKFC
ncbi:hypothetical protein O6H91_Y496900 [Diphasiastrum complanatum]|nr:hypothetical protein O6H91_Y496900 [Diphasiastrum complanatum]